MTQEHIEDRIRALEGRCDLATKHYQYSKFINVILSLMLGVLVFSGANSHPNDEIVSARGFVLVGDDGKKKVELGLNGEKSTVFTMLGPDGEPRLTLGVSEDGESIIHLTEPGERRSIAMGFEGKHGAVLSFQDKNQNPRLMMSVGPDGSPELRFLEQNGEERIHFFVNDDHVAQVGVNGRNGKGWVGIGATENAGLVVRDAEGNARANLGWVPGDGIGKTYLNLLEPGNQERIALGLLPDRGTLLYFRDSKEKRRIQIEDLAGADPAVVLRDAAGNETFRAPR